MMQTMPFLISIHGESFLCMRSNYISIEENSVIFQIV